MKSKIKRHSRSVLSVILAISMLISTMMVGIIATDAAQANDESVGDGAFIPAGTYFLDYSSVSWYLDDNCAQVRLLGGTNSSDDKFVHVQALDTTNHIAYFVVNQTDAAKNFTKLIFARRYSNADWNDQTEDIEYVSGKNCWKINAKTGTQQKHTGSWTSSNYTPPAEKTTTLYVLQGLTYNNLSMSNAYLWEEKNYHLVDFPGEAMSSSPWTTETVNGYTYYKRTFSNYWENFQVILNDGEGGTGKQTANSVAKTTNATYYINEIDGTNNKPVLSSAPLGPDFYLFGDIGKDAIASVNGVSTNEIANYPAEGSWENTPPEAVKINTAAGASGKYSITVVTKDVDWAINIGMYQGSTSKQRGFKLGDTWYNTVGADYTVPYAGVSDAQNLYIVDGSGSLVLLPNTEYTITIDQTQTLTDYPYGKITITTNKADAIAMAKVKKFDIETGALGTTTSNAPATIGTATAVPKSGLKNFSATFTAALTDSTNYDFAGWYTTPACSGDAKTSEAEFTETISDTVTYYALFTEKTPPKYAYTITAAGANVTDIGGKGVTTSPQEVYKGGTLTFKVTPPSGKTVDEVTSTSGNATVKYNNDGSTYTVTVSNITAAADVVVSFKDIETLALTINLDSATYGKVSVKYYNSSGTQVTEDVTATGTVKNVQKDRIVELTAVPNTTGTKGDFNGWTLEAGKYQRSKDTPLTGKTIKIIPSEAQTVTAKLVAEAAEEKDWGVNFDTDGTTVTHKFRHYSTETHKGKTDVYKCTFNVTKGDHQFYFFVSSINYKFHSSQTNLNPSKEEWVKAFARSDATDYKVNFPETADYTFYMYATKGRDGNYDYYEVDVVKGSGSSGNDDTPDVSGLTKLYVFDGIATRYKDAIQDYGTNKFGESIISIARQGVAKTNYYDAAESDKAIHTDAGYDEDQLIYYYDPTSDVDFRVQTTVSDSYPAIGVRAFVMNGMTYPAKKSSSGNVYYADIALGANSGQGVLEVIPVYYNTLIPDRDYVKFYVDANTIGDKWGKTIGYSIWYDPSSNHGMEGGYPGQPLMSDGNLLYGYIPKYYVAKDADSLPVSTNRPPFAGVLLTNLAEHNKTHQDVLKDWGLTANDAYKTNYQTFDYEDPVKINAIDDVDVIEFVAKYEESNTDHQTGTHYVTDYSTDNKLIDATTSTWPSGITKPASATDLKGFELLTDIDGKPVDIYNDKITGGADFSNAVYVISVGNQIVGENQWDTVWMVYSNASTPSFITAKNPAEFINASTKDNTNLVGKTVYINYEKFLDGDAKSSVSNSGDRIDGRWLYSKSTDPTTLRLRVATKSGNTLTFLNDGIDWADISDGAHNGEKETGFADTKLLNLSNRTTEVTAKINPVGYKVVGMYMLGARYSSTTDNGFSSSLTDYDDLNVSGTATSFVNAKDNRMVIVVEPIPVGELDVFHQMYGGPGAHKIDGFFYSKVELFESDGTTSANISTEDSGKYGVFSRNRIELSKFTVDAPNNSHKKLKVTIKTGMTGAATFNQWYETDYNSGYRTIDSEAVRGQRGEVTKEIMINVDDLYNQGGTLIHSNLDYYSDLQASDSVVINHLLTDATIAAGISGRTYTKVTVVDANDNPLTGGSYQVYERTTKVDSKFITADSAEESNQVKVEIWNVPSNYSEFGKFYTTDQTVEMPSGNSASGGIFYSNNNTTITFEGNNYPVAVVKIPVDYFFKLVDDGDGNLIREFDYSKKDVNLYSSLTMKDYNFSVEFIYKSRIWGDQSYEVRRQIAPSEYEAGYFTISDNKAELTTDESKRAEFLATICPYEENFKEKLKWNFTDEAGKVEKLDYDTTTHTDQYQVTAVTEEDKIIDFQVKFPFEYTSTTKDGEIVVTPTEVDTKVGGQTVKAVRYLDPENTEIIHSETFRPTLEGMTQAGKMVFMDWVSLNDVHSAEQSKEKDNKEAAFVTAPEKLYLDTTSGAENAVEYKFQYWSVRKADTAGEYTIEYAKCYNTKFNFALYQSSLITPVYATTEAPENSEVTTSLTWAQNSRNQWNKQAGSAPYTNRAVADRIFVDFFVNYNYKGIQLNTIKTQNPNNVKAGVVLVKVAEIEDKTQVLTNEAYRAQYETNAETIAAHKNEVERILKNDTDGLDFKQSSFALTAIDNKNMMDFAYSYANLDQADPAHPATTHKNYVYRAYSYITYEDENHNTQYVISDPAYFTFYDIASIAVGEIV